MVPSCSPSETLRNPLPPGWNGSGALPLEIDVGCHKGLFLVEMAGLYPAHNFLGVEFQSERVQRTQKKIRTLARATAAVVQADGLEALQGLPDHCVDVIHVLFPDPWPKRRHYIRRLVQTPFFVTALRVLKPGGLLRLVTDDADYAAAMAATAPDFPALVPFDADHRAYPLTEFQKKFLTDGRPVHRLILKKIT